MSLTKLVSNFPLERWVLWVGAGVSYPEPSSLPLGIPLTTFALRECCGETTTTRIMKIWEEANGIVGTPDNPAPLGWAPRLESILGDVDDVRAESAGLEFDFLGGFRSFTGAPFNLNHLYLADLLSRGATVVTTNFDTCIENAYRWITKGADHLALGRELGTPYYCPQGGGAGRVWHVHGTAEDVASLGATIRAVKEGLPAGFRDWLDGAFGRSALVIFLGYGAGDSFDVNLYFSGKGDSQFANCAACFVQHPGVSVPPGAKLLLRPFRTKAVVTEDTTEVLKFLSGNSLLPPPPPPTPAWEGAFLRNAVTTARGEVRGYLICKLAFTLGANVGLLDEWAYGEALRFESHFHGQDFHRTLAYVCRVRGESALEKQHDLKSNRGPTAMLGYYYSRGEIRRALKYAKPLDELFDDAGRGGELGWDTYTSMSAHCRAALDKYFLNPFAGGVSGPDRLRIERLVELTELLSDVPLRNVRYMNQVVTASRFNFLFKAFLNGVKDDRTIERVLSLYGEGASVAGFISTYRDVAVMHFLLHRFHRAGGLVDAAAYIDKSLRLAEVVGDIPSIKRARKLSAYFKLFLLIRPGFRN